MRWLRDAIWVWRLVRALQRGEKAREEQVKQWRGELCVCLLGDPARADDCWSRVLQPVNR